ncbi:acyltransferase family protein [Streptacidiphilus rugosus]|uniref:acyltransferase family protein n=1 Tax=Streptacidiphilus rugosus TaxID=405783 RepID=UPI0009FCCB04|nr:acyltransferase [Streptacidiphilus rugosus]
MIDVRTIEPRPEPAAPVLDGAPAPKAAARLGWLDALRGIAALLVVFQHTGSTLLPPLYRQTHAVFDAGICGVFLFFLVSGYIVPASLERKGDLRGFWIGRYFRIYPLITAVVVVGALCLPVKVGAVSGQWHTQPWLLAGANGPLLAELLGVGNTMRVSWTLAYEMAFYFLVSGLFALGWHRRSAPVAVGFGTLAVVAGAALPMGLLSHGPTATARTVVATDVIVVLAMGLVILGGRGLRRTGVLTLSALALVLVLVNSGIVPFESMMILATMFAGTAIYRAEHGQIKRWHGVLSSALVLTAGLVSGLLYDGRYLRFTWTETVTSWCTAIIGAWLLFGLGLLVRHRRIPRVLSWLGAISYACYLLHVPAFVCLEWIRRRHGFTVHGPVQHLTYTALFLAILLASSYAAHRLIELPGQRLGRRAANWISARRPA